MSRFRARWNSDGRVHIIGMGMNVLWRQDVFKEFQETLKALEPVEVFNKRKEEEEKKAKVAREEAMQRFEKEKNEHQERLRKGEERRVGQKVLVAKREEENRKKMTSKGKASATT